MSAYEYIRTKLDWGDLEELNRLGSVGWRVASVVLDRDICWVLLERPLRELIQGKK